MIENQAAAKWERLALEYQKERDECLDIATKNREEADRLRARVAELEAAAEEALTHFRPFPGMKRCAHCAMPLDDSNPDCIAHRLALVLNR